MKNLRFFLVFFLVVFLSFAAMAQSPWILQRASGLPNSVNPEVQFSAVDEDVCWGINTINSQYLRTTNGGTNWTVSTITGATGGAACIKALDANTAWVCISGGVFKTTDAGLTWDKQLTAFQGFSGHPNVIHFFDYNNGVCVGDPNNGYWAIYTTTNGGTDWTRVPSVNIPSPAPSNELGIYNIEATSSGNSFWFSTFWGSLYKSTDRGITWTVARNVVGDFDGYGFAFKDSLNGLACTFVSSKKIAKTSDGGTTWTQIVPLPSGLSALSPFNINYVKGTDGSYVITSNYNIGGAVQAVPGSAYSNDNGETWIQVDNLPHGSTSFSSWNIGWSGSVNDSVYKWVGLPGVIPISGLQLWLKADEGVTLNGSTVSSWIDQSGNGNDALQSNSNRQPIFVDNGLNNKPILHFDGVDDRLGLYGSTTMSQISLFLVFKIDSGLVGNNGTDPFPYHPVLFGNFNIGAFGLGMRNYIVGNSPNLIDVFADADIYARAELPNIAAFDQWKVVSVLTNQTIWNTTFRSNGVDATITPSSINMSLSVPIGTPNGTSGIGGADDVPAGHFTFKGDIAEVIVYDTVLSASQRLEVEQYLNEKYNFTVGVEDNQTAALPEEFILNQNYPNPFNPSTNIEFRIADFGFVSLKVYDVLGNEIATLVNEEKPAGSYEVEFNASILSSGIYFYKLQTDSFIETKKMILLK